MGQKLLVILSLIGSLSLSAQAQQPLPSGSSAFVLIGRLHALPGYEDRVVALSAEVDKKVEAGEQVSHQEFCAWAEANLGPLCVS